MALVGDVIVNARELMPDRAPVVAPPSGFTSAQFGASPTLAAGTYLVSASFVNSWGETTAVALANVAVDGAHGIQVTGTLPVGVTKLRVYYGIAAVNQFQDFTALPAQIIAAGTAGVPTGTAGGTAINRCYLPDGDGAYIPAATIYRWFNQALDEAVNISGGIQDRTGVGSVVGQALYQLPVIGWVKITNVWYDGYDVFSGSKRDIFRRNVTSAYSVLSVAVTLTPNTVIEAFPQPQRTSGVLVSTGSLSSTASSVGYSVTTNFVLPFGVAQITQGSASEIVMYASLSNNTISGLTRGLGGTIPQAFTTGATITELNFMIDGYRRAVPVAVGQSTNVLQVPPAWVPLLPMFILSKFRQAEKEFREAKDLMQEFQTKVKAEAMATKPLSGPVQIGSSNRGPEIYGSGPWGVIVP